MSAAATTRSPDASSNAMISRLRGVTFMMYRSFPFFACLLENCRIIADSSVRTASISPSGILRMSPAFVEDLVDEDYCFVLAHEVSHLAFLHHARRGNRDPLLWNVACDFAVNLLVADAIGYSAPPVAGLMDVAFRGLTVEQIYEQLLLEPPPVVSPGAHTGGDLSGSDDEQPDGSGVLLRDRRTKAPKGQRAEERWKDLVAHAAANARCQTGRLHKSLERAVESLLQARVPWAQVIRERLRHASCRPGHDEYSWTRPSRRSTGQVILPGLVERCPPTVAFAVDTSGSITEEQLARAFSELRGLQQATNARVYWLACDAEVHQHGWLEPEVIPPSAGGGGGTDFRPIFMHLEEARLQPDILAIVTDAQGEFPDEAPPFPVLWVVSGRADSTPFGEIVRIDD